MNPNGFGPLRPGRARESRLRLLSRARRRLTPASVPRDPLSGEELFLRRVWRSTRIQWHRFAIGALAIWAIYALVLSPHGWVRMSALKRQLAVEAESNAALEARRDSLDLMLARIDRGERSVLEERAREDFGFAGKNDRIYLLPTDAEDAAIRSDAEIHGADRFSDRARQGLTAPAGGR